MNTAIKNNLPILSNEGGLSAYLEQIKKFQYSSASFFKPDRSRQVPGPQI